MDPLAGVKEKREEEGRLFCKPCWVELYAPTCYICKQKIAGPVTYTDKTKKKAKHKECKEKKKALASGGSGLMMKPPAKGGKAKKPNMSGAKNKMDSMADVYGALA